MSPFGSESEGGGRYENFDGENEVYGDVRYLLIARSSRSSKVGGN